MDGVGEREGMTMFTRGRLALYSLKGKNDHDMGVADRITDRLTDIKSKLKGRGRQ